MKISNKMIFEKTCRCITSVDKFQEGHEYQVDINLLKDNGYKVYPNGTYYGFVEYTEDDFNKYFEEIK